MGYAPDSQQLSDYTVTWHRRNGLFSNEIDGHTVTGASANNWYAFYDMMSNLPGGLSPRQIISPELMTASDIPLTDIAKSSVQQAVRRRLDQMATLSRRLPGVEFILGTPEYTTGATHNSLMRLQAGKSSVLTRKSLLTPTEESAFSRAPQCHPPQPEVRHLICADMIGHNETTASCLRASCCWAVPLTENEVPGYTPPPDEERYLGAMHDTIRYLMAQQTIRHLFIVDRTPPGGGTRPYNCIVRRD